MRVGLLSMQRVPNYGSFWQAYCLKEMISGAGRCDVSFVDIIPGEKEPGTEYKKSFSFSKIKRIPYYWFQKRKRAMFRDFQRTVLGCSDEANYSADYDAMVIGSDEVFNFVQNSPWGFSKQLYGDIANDNVNCYAACFGFTTMDAIQRYKRTEAIASSLENLKNISVRDQNSSEIIEQLTGRVPRIHLDPVLVGDLPKELPGIKEHRYILVYSYDFRLSDPEVIAQVRSFAKAEKLRIYSVGFYQTWVDKNILPNPMELLAYYRNADYIVTDTFHGTIFSARMHKPFVSIIRETNQQKLGDLLVRIGMKERQYRDGDSIQDKLKAPIDFESFEFLRKEERTRTDEYLMQCISHGRQD